MTFANDQDVMSFRHHMYEKRGGKEVVLNEVGPRFEMQLYQLRLGTLDQVCKMPVWVSWQTVRFVIVERAVDDVFQQYGCVRPQPFCTAATSCNLEPLSSALIADMNEGYLTTRFNTGCNLFSGGIALWACYSVCSMGHGMIEVIFLDILIQNSPARVREPKQPVMIPWGKKYEHGCPAARSPTLISCFMWYSCPFCRLKLKTNGWCGHIWIPAKNEDFYNRGFKTSTICTSVAIVHDTFLRKRGHGRRRISPTRERENSWLQMKTISDFATVSFLVMWNRRVVNRLHCSGGGSWIRSRCHQDSYPSCLDGGIPAGEYL